MEKIRELYVILEDRPNSIGEMCRILKKKGISIYAIRVFIDSARLYVSDFDKANTALQEFNYATDEREVLKTVLPNRTGALMDFTMKIGNAGININYLYGALESTQKKGTIILEVDKPDLALNIFKNHNFQN